MGARRPPVTGAMAPTDIRGAPLIAETLLVLMDPRARAPRGT